MASGQRREFLSLDPTEIKEWGQSQSPPSASSTQSLQPGHTDMKNTDMTMVPRAQKDRLEAIGAIIKLNQNINQKKQLLQTRQEGVSAFWVQFRQSRARYMEAGVALPEETAEYRAIKLQSDSALTEDYDQIIMMIQDIQQIKEAIKEEEEKLLQMTQSIDDTSKAALGSPWGH